MKKNGYLRKFIVMFLVFVMLMADSSMTTFAETVGSVRQQNADQGVVVQDGDDSVALFSAGGQTLAEGKYGRVEFSYNNTKNAFKSSPYYVNTPLGVAGNFGVVAFDTAHITVDCNSNILAQTLDAVSGDWGTRPAIDEASYIQNYKVHATQPERKSGENGTLSTLVVGDSVDVAGELNQRFSINGAEIATNKLKVMKDTDSENNPYIDLPEVESEIKNISSTLAKQKNVGCSQNFVNVMNQRSINVTCASGECAYYNTNAKDIAGTEIVVYGLKSGASLVVNIDCANVAEINLPHIKVDGASFNETNDFSHGRVILNLLNSAEKKVNLQLTYASVIAPDATINATQNVNGSIIGKNVNVSAENHRTTFTGTTTPAEVEADGTKTVDGKEPTDEQKFEFELFEDQRRGNWNNAAEALNSSQWKLIETVQNDGSKINFSKLNYSKPSDVGTHWYKVSEKSDVNNTSYIYDKTVYLMKVVVANNNNIFDAAKSYYKVENNQEKNATKIQFNNTTVQQKGNLKIVKAAGAGTNLSGKTFYFKVTDSNENVVKNNGSNVWPIEYINGAEITITDLTPGVYTVVETDEKGEAVTTGTSFPYTVSGAGNVTVEDGNTATITVTNTAVSGTKIALTGTKELKNRDLTENEFEFEVREGNTVVATGTNDATGKITFSEISYGPEAVGDHTYKISEKAGTDKNIEYSSEVKTVVVNVSLDQKTGKMEANIVSGKSDEVKFTNTYKTGTKIALTGTKELKNRTLTDKEFKFEVREGNTVVATGTNDATGKITFSEISYGPEAVGDHTYKISEKAGTDKNIEYSSEVKTVVVNVSLDQKTGKMEANIVSGKSDEVKFTNTYKTISISGTKTWDDANNQDGKRPESIKVRLHANGTEVANKEVTVADDWTYSFTDLPKYANGEEIVYTVTEDAVPDYTTAINGTTITNSYTPGKTSITVTKAWADNDNQDGIRPDSIKVQLYAGEDAQGEEVTLDGTNNWTYTWTGLDAKKDGQDIVYTVKETGEVTGYTSEISGDAQTGFVITNTHKTEITSVEGKKVWDDANNQDGKRPNSIKVRLLANGTEVATKDVTAADNWTYSFTDLPKYANGEEIVYTVTEDAVPDYTTAINGTTITNSYTPGKTSITVTKAWADNDNQDGIRPDSIKVQLYAGEDAQGEEVTLDGTNNWTYTWTGLDAKKDGQDIVYTVKETGEVTGYTSEISGDAQTGFVITNTHKTEITSVEGKKVWDDADNQDGKRPESIKVRLLANGTEVATKDVTAADNWTYSFTDLPKFADGKEIVYTVTEDAVADYTTAIDGTTITNSYKPGKTSITVTKAWADNDNQDGIRPENIKVQLYAGETAQGEEVTLSADNNWTYTWSELDAKKDGQDIVYTVRETEVPAGYEAIVTGTAAEGFILTNTHETEVISVEGTKTWNDNDQTTKRPESITVRLLADGKEAGSQKVTADSNWTYKFTELPKYAAGKEIVYTVSEDAVPGYITSVNGNNLINTITSVKVSKVDITDHKELAGAHIQILDKDGNIIDEWDSTWEAHEVTGLKTNEQYTLRETVAPDGYTVTSDTTFTLKEDGTVDKDNTQTTVSDDGTLLVEDSKTSVKVSKVDIADGKELEGAHIQVIDEDENIVAEWNSTKEPHVIEGLKTDKKYILRETVAPTGYELTNDTTFVLKADGTVDTEKTTTVSKDGVLLVQDKLATGQSIAVTKKLTTITGDLRAMDQTFYVALYSDEACTQRVSDVKAIEFKNASSSTVVFNENIEVNKDYYIAECSQDGTAQSMGALADGTMYEAKFNNGNKATVKEANGTTTVYFDNVFSSIPDGYYKQGKLTITKKLLGADGNAKKSDNVFYAGIFDDADYTQLSTQVSQNIVKLDLAGGSEVSQVIKIGLDVNKTVTLYVTETDSNGKPVAGTSGFAYKVSVDGSTVTIDEANENASVTITNTENSTTTKTTKTTTEESGNESGSSASSHSMSSSTKAPKTGDDTPIAMYVIILIAAAALIVFGFEKRRRSNRK